MIVLWNSAEMRVTLTLINNTGRYAYEWQAERELARDMLAYLRDRLAEHDTTLGDITGIGVFRGPGSYTGLRIGLAVLNTVATDRHVPIVGSTSVDGWQAECERRLAAGENDEIVLPEYGAAARVTKPRK